MASHTRAGFLRAHYTAPRERTQVSELDPGFASATAQRAATRGVPGSNVVRAVKWAATWRLPSNQRAYQILSLKRIPERLSGIAFEPLGNYALFDKFRRAVLRTWGSLVQHEPALQDTPTTSWVALGMHWAFPHNPLLCLEASMHVLANMMPIRPDAEIPAGVVDAVVQLVESKRAALTAKWRRFRIDPAEIIAPMIKNLGVPILGESLWPIVFGTCCVGGDDHSPVPPRSVLEPSSALLLFVAALLLIRAQVVEKARTRERIFEAHTALFQQDGGATVPRTVAATMARTVRELTPVIITLGPALLPRRGMVHLNGTDGADTEYYPPLLCPDDEPDRNVAVSVPEFLASIEREEVELAKRGMGKMQSVIGAAEAMGWTRAMAVQQEGEHPNLAVLEAELARRRSAAAGGRQQPDQNQLAAAEMFAAAGGSGGGGGRVNLQQAGGGAAASAARVYQPATPVLSSPATAPVHTPAVDLARAEAEHLYQQHRSASDYHGEGGGAAGDAVPSTTSPVRRPFVVVPSNRAWAQSQHQAGGGASSARPFFPGDPSLSSSRTATIVKTQLPPRSASTRPPSAVAAMLRVPGHVAQHPAYPGGGGASPGTLGISSPTASSSHPSGVVNSPKRASHHQHHQMMTPQTAVMGGAARVVGGMTRPTSAHRFGSGGGHTTRVGGWSTGPHQQQQKGRYSNFF